MKTLKVFLAIFIVSAILLVLPTTCVCLLVYGSSLIPTIIYTSAFAGIGSVYCTLECG